MQQGVAGSEPSAPAAAAAFQSVDAHFAHITPPTFCRTFRNMPVKCMLTASADMDAKHARNRG